MNSVRVRVPATSANLGPGFDSLGVALRLYNTTTVVRGRGPAPGDMASAAADLFFGKTQMKPFAFHWSVEGDVPRSRGLGSSVTVRLGVLHGLNELAGRPLKRHGVFELCAELEGHPDNAAPGAFGGFCIAPAKGPVQSYVVGEDFRKRLPEGAPLSIKLGMALGGLPTSTLPGLNAREKEHTRNGVHIRTNDDKAFYDISTQKPDRRGKPCVI